MNPRLLFLVALGLSGAAAAEPPASPAPATTPATAAPVAPRSNRSTTPAARSTSTTLPTESFDSFRLVGDRNIFNANRTGRRDRSSEEAPPRLDVITLVGTMESDRGLRAFFDGSSSAFRKALRVGDSVDAYKVKEVTPRLVTLERDGKDVPMTVGQQLRRPLGGDWALIGADVVRSEAATAAAKAGEGKIDPTAPVAIPANADEVTRRLMERRNKDLKK
jgi:hypothetical protein